MLLVTGVQRVELHQHTKFCQNRSIGREDIKIFQFFKMAAVHQFEFVWGIFGLPTVRYLGVSITLQNRRRRRCASSVLTAIGLIYENPVYLTPPPESTSLIRSQKNLAKVIMSTTLQLRKIW